jgi:hypothetical protein
MKLKVISVDPMEPFDQSLLDNHDVYVTGAALNVLNFAQDVQDQSGNMAATFHYFRPE